MLLSDSKYIVLPVREFPASVNNVDRDQSNRRCTHTELLAAADDVIEERVAGAEVLREADVLLLPLRFPHHLHHQNNRCGQPIVRFQP